MRTRCSTPLWIFTKIVPTLGKRSSLIKIGFRYSFELNILTSIFFVSGFNPPYFNSCSLYPIRKKPYCLNNKAYQSSPTTFSVNLLTDSPLNFSNSWHSFLLNNECLLFLKNQVISSRKNRHKKRLSELLRRPVKIVSLKCKKRAKFDAHTFLPNYTKKSSKK